MTSQPGFVERVEARVLKLIQGKSHVLWLQVFHQALTEILAEAEPVKLYFPTCLRKMWSGTEIQQWLDAQKPLFAAPPADERDARIAELEAQKQAMWGRLQQSDADHVAFVLGGHSEVCTERDELRTQIAAAQAVVDAARNLIAQKGRHNTEQAYKRLAAAIATRHSAARSDE